MFVISESNVRYDVSYYWRSLHAMLHGVALSHTLREYPLPVLGTMLPQYWLSGGSRNVFWFVFPVSMVVIDAAFMRFLVRANAKRSGAGEWSAATAFWVAFIPLLGPMAYFRFDLITSVVAGVALAGAVTRPARSGVLVAVGTGLKLWPALLLPALSTVHTRARMLTGFAVCGLALTVGSTLIGGFDRLVSPLRWQSGRGLQIESVWATPVMIGHAVHPHGVWRIKFSPYMAFEIHGAATRALLTASSASQLVAVGFLALVWRRAARCAPSPRTSAVICLATIVLTMITNKTFSPQYVLWLGGPVAALLITDTDRSVRRLATLTLVLAGLTQLEFPILYNGLDDINATLRTAATVALTLRNLLVLSLGATACSVAWRSTAAPGSSTGRDRRLPFPGTRRRTDSIDDPPAPRPPVQQR